MPRKVNSLPFFITFFLLSIFLILLGSSGLFSGISGLVSRGISPVRSATFNILTLPAFKNKTIENLTAENQSLLSQLADRQNLISEDKALKDQFAIAGNNSLSQLPAKVIGESGFVPGVSSPQYLIINQGSNSGIKTGAAVVIKNNLVGRVLEVFPNNAKVELVINSKTSFTGKILGDDGTNGVVKGNGNSVILENVLLSRTLKKNSLVTTKGDVNESGQGYPPDLVVGKIISVDKKPSDLFQKAEVASFVNFENLNTVFVLK